MNITVTLTANPEFLKVLEGLIKAFTPGAALSATNGKKVAGAAAVAREEIPAPTAPASEVGDQSVSAPAPKVEGVTIEKVRELVQAKSQGGKREEVKALLAEFGADKVTNLSKDQYAAFYQKVEAL